REPSPASSISPTWCSCQRRFANPVLGCASAAGFAERVAGGRVAALHADREPVLALGRSAVGEGLRVHAPGGLLLEAVVADRGGGVERLGDLAAAHFPGRVRRVAPDARVAVGLQLERDREAAARLRVLLLRAPHLPLGADQVLHAVAVLVRDDVGLREVAAARMETPLQLVEEAEVEID